MGGMDRSVPSATQLTLPLLPRAVLLFARAPSAESAIKPLGTRGQEIHRAVLVSVLPALRGLPPDVDLVLAGDQERGLRPVVRQVVGGERCLADVPVFGDGFGARFRCAVDGALGLGYAHVIAVGGDIAEIRVRHMTRALSLLAEGEALVIGPSPDGGFYLLGFCSSPAKLLRSIPWRGPRALRALLQRCTEEGQRPVLLEPLADLDDAESVETLRGRLGRLQPASDLYRLLSRILDSVGLEGDAVELDSGLSSK